MAAIFSDNATGKLAVSISATDTVISLEAGNGAKFPAPVSGSFFFATLVDVQNNIEVGWEIVGVVARVDDAMSIVRLVDYPGVNTVPRAWNAGTPFELRLVSATLTGLTTDVEANKVMLDDIIDSRDYNPLFVDNTSATVQYGRRYYVHELCTSGEPYSIPNLPDDPITGEILRLIVPAAQNVGDSFSFMGWGGPGIAITLQFTAPNPYCNNLYDPYFISPDLLPTLGVTVFIRAMSESFPIYTVTYIGERGDGEGGDPLNVWTLSMDLGYTAMPASEGLFSIAELMNDGPTPEPLMITTGGVGVTAAGILSVNGVDAKIDTAHTHSQATHAPATAQKNSDITKAEIEAKLTGAITSHTHTYGDVTLTGTQTLTNKTISGGIHTNVVDLQGSVRQTIVDVASGTAFNLSLGNYFIKTISGNTTFTVSNTPTSRAYAFTVELTHTSGTITWFSGVEWPGGVAPTLTAGKTHLFTFVTDNGGTRWRGVAIVDYTN